MTVIDARAKRTTIVPAEDVTGRRVICIDTGDGVEVRIYGSVKQLRRLAVAFAAALDGDVPSAAEVGV